ncbi:MAG: hypothetical protein LQ352_006652 [Teloschistes flavicans]|nr:MAG: hypothetical protein LQ352_006652 [Teloschistes flavicans]
MGQGSSKPPPSSTQHVFTSDSPVNFSPDLINALQASPEVCCRPIIYSSKLTRHHSKTDSTRSKDLELHIQRRVHSELARLEAEHTKRLEEFKEQISASPDSTTESIHPDARTPDQSTSPGGPDHKAAAQGDKMRDLGRQSVQKDIDMLQEKLKKRKIKEEVVQDKAVEKAKSEVINCLRLNDRRPLDCWREVEAFKGEVGRLEKDFLEKVML